MGTLLELKHIDKIRLRESEKWIIKSHESNAFPVESTEYAEWAQYAFLVQRTVLPETHEYPNGRITFSFLIRSEPLRRALREMMGDGPGVNWTGFLVEIDHRLLLAFLPRMAEEASDLRSTAGISSEDDLEAGTMKKQMAFLIGCLESEYATTLEEVRNLVQHGEITFDLLWAVCVPGEVIFAECSTTGEPRAYLLRRWQRERRGGEDKEKWYLTCEYVEAADDHSVADQQLGLAYTDIVIESFDGVRKIAELEAFPIKYHANAIDIRQKLIHRGRKWVKLIGVHHRHYDGLAYWNNHNMPEWVRTTHGNARVNGRIMIDRRTFSSSQPLYQRPIPWKSLSGGLWNVMVDKEPSDSIPEVKDDDHLLLASPIVYL